MLLSNKAKCLICGNIIQSKSVHDFVTCACGNLSVDGGLEYLKRGMLNYDKRYFEELSKFSLEEE